MRRAVACLAAVVAGAALAACGAALNQPERATLAALALATPTVPQPPLPPPSPKCGNPTASLRPKAMPAPGAMPAGSFMWKIEHQGHLIAGVDQNTLQFAYFDPLRRAIVGFEIDLLRRLADRIFGNRPNDIVFKAITTDERIRDVQNGTVDVVADAMTITCARRQLVDFSTVYYNAGQRILVPVNSPVRSVRQLGGRPVCATRGSTSLEILESLTPRPRPYRVDQRTDCLVALQEGHVAAITSDDSILLGFEKQDPDTKIVGPVFAKDPYGMAINKAHGDFVRFVNGFLAEIRANGVWRSIYQHWLPGPAPAPPKATYGG